MRKTTVHLWIAMMLSALAVAAEALTRGSALQLF
jgi:hypothetical protein